MKGIDMAMKIGEKIANVTEKVLDDLIMVYLVSHLAGGHTPGGKPQQTADGKPVPQKQPKPFGLGYDDEEIFEPTRTSIPLPRRNLLDLLINAMKDFEKAFFRIIVAGISTGSGPAADMKVKADYIEELLKEIDEEVKNGATEKAAAEAVVQKMRDRKMISRNPQVQAAMDRWIKISAWFDKRLREFLGVQPGETITEAHWAAGIRKIHEKIPTRTDAEVWGTSPATKAVARVALNAWVLVIASLAVLVPLAIMMINSK